jgi:hypothetical protein
MKFFLPSQARFFGVILFLFYLFAPLFCFAEETLAVENDSPRYEITATYNEKKHRIEGVVQITFTNTGKTPLSEIYLFLYPNLYQDKDPKQKSEFYQKAYPVGFNPGSIQILSMEDSEGKPLSSSDFFGAKTLTKIRLITPILPGNAFHFLVQFVTQIPERYGVFGHFRDWVTLQGGWYPYLPRLTDGKWDLHGRPPLSRFHLDLTVPKEIDPMASVPLFVKEEKKRQVQFVGLGDSLSFLSLSLGKQTIEKQKQTGPVTFLYRFSERNQYYGEQVFEAGNRAISFFLSEWDSFPETQIQLSHAALHQDIVTAGTRLLYVDSKLFKVFPALKRFHEIRVARGIFRILWQEILPWEEPWVLEMLAAISAEDFAKERYPNELDLKRWLKPIAFLPFIDQVLYSDDLLLRQIYFHKMIPETETLDAFHQPFAPLYPQLSNLLTPEVLEKIVTDYKDQIQSRERKPLRTLLLKQGEKMERFFKGIEAYTKESTITAPIDFSLVNVQRKKVGEQYQTTFDIQKKGFAVEPVQIVLHEKSGTKTSLVWNGEGDSYREFVMTKSPVLVVALDPEETTRDKDRGNNRDPVSWKVLLIRSSLNYNLTTRFLGFDANLQFQPVYSEKNKINVGFLRADVRDVGSLQYSRILQNRHTVSTGISNQSSRATESVFEESVVTASLAYVLRYPHIPFVQGYTQWLTGRYPEWNITLQYDKGLTGSNDDMFQAVFDLRRSFAFSNYHQIQTRVLAGASTGNLFKENRFFLGGDARLRGYTPLRFEGENISLLTLEYRFPLRYETDINLFGLALTHTLQGAIFADWGAVGSPSEIFRSDQYKSDAGLGFRWFIDFLGMMPTTFGLDIAWPINATIPEENKPHYYLTGGRLF